MEAVWRRILLLLLVGVLLTLLVFPIVRGEPENTISNTSSGERIQTKFKEVYIGPVDRSLPQDGRIDMYEDHPEEWVFTYQLLAMDENGSYEVAVTYAKVWFIISMGKYENITKGLTDIRGRVHYNYTSRFTDTFSGAPFEFERGEWRALLTISVEYYGDDDHFGTIRTREGIYHGYKPYEPPSREEKVILWIQFLFEVNIFLSFFVGLPSIFFYGIFKWTAKNLRQWGWEIQMSERDSMPRFNNVLSPSVSCPEGPSSLRP